MNTLLYKKQQTIKNTRTEVGFRDKEIGQGHSIGSSRIGHPTIKDVQKSKKGYDQ